MKYYEAYVTTVTIHSDNYGKAVIVASEINPAYSVKKNYPHAINIHFRFILLILLGVSYLMLT